MSHRAQYEVSLCDTTRELWVEPVSDPSGEGRGQVSSEQGQWEIQVLGPDEYLLRRPGQGQSHRVWVRLDGEIPQVCCEGRSEKVEIISARDKALARATGAASASGNGSLSSPMPGRIVSVLVEAGQSVKAGQAVVIVEAMKMENELTAPIDGEVQSIEVSADQAVDAGQRLLVITPAASE